MEKAKLENITLDEEDAKLFKLKGDYLLKAKAIKYSILPKLNVILEEALSRIRKIYDIEVFDENSIFTSAPNFREKRTTELGFDYDYSYVGIGGSRLPIWKGFIRTDNKPVKIIPYTLCFWFDDNGLKLVFTSLRYKVSLSNNSYEKYYNFLLENIDYILTIQSLSKMNPVLQYRSDDDKIIIPFSAMIQELINEKYYCLDFVRELPLPVNIETLNSIVNSFIIFFPIYYSLLNIAQGVEPNFRKLIEKLKLSDIEYIKQNTNETTISIEEVNINESKFVRAGIRWQVFERDNFKCVACGKSSHDGAILHVDHIVPRSKGGKDELNNYQTLCHLCNIGKSNKSNKNLRNKIL